MKVLPSSLKGLVNHPFVSLFFTLFSSFFLMFPLLSSPLSRFFEVVFSEFQLSISGPPGPQTITLFYLFVRISP